MGCSCGSQNPSEEKLIFNRFDGLFKKNNFDMSIEKYNDNYQRIKKLGKDDFQVLGKKNALRAGFIKEVLKFYDSKDINKKLFFIVICNILLKEIPVPGDMEQPLIEISSNVFEKHYNDNTSLKKALFHHSKLLTAFLSKTKNNISGFLDIKKYLDKVKEAESKKLDDNEVFPFFKEVVIFVGNYFTKMKEVKIIPKEMQSTLLGYYITTLKYFSDFIKEKFETLRKNFLTKQIENSELIKNPTFNSLDEVYTSLFNFLNGIIQDITFGKVIWKEIDEKVNKIIDKEIIDNFNEILILALLHHCQTSNKELITSLFEFLSDKIIQGSSQIYYEILCEYCRFIIEDDNLSERCMKLFAKIFIKELENKNDNNFIEHIQEIISTNDNSQYKLIFLLMVNISTLFKEANKEQQKLIFHKLGIIEKYSTFEIEDNSGPTFNTQKIDKADLSLLLSNFSSYDKENKKEFLIFFIDLFKFVESNFLLEIENDLQFKKSIYITLVNFLYDVDQINSPKISNNLITIFKIFRYKIRKYSLKHFEDSFLIYQILSNTFRQTKQLLSSNATTASVSKIYLLTLLNLSLVIKGYKLPNSLEKINADIIQNIQQVHPGLAEILKKNDIENLLQNESLLYACMEKEFNSNTGLSNEIGKKVLDIIYSKVFGKSSSLNNFFEDQIKNKAGNTKLKELNADISKWDLPGKKDNDVITEGNASSIGDFIKDDLNDISIHFTEDVKKLHSYRQFSEISSNENRKDSSAKKEFKILDTDSFSNDNNLNNIKI